MLDLESNGIQSKQLPSLFLFVIFLSDGDNDTASSLLCPENISNNDFKSFIQIKFDQAELDLFLKYYRLLDDKYVLNTNESIQDSCAIDQLEQLLGIFLAKFADCEALKQKYLKTIQQAEIEFVLKHINPASIIWLKSKRATHLSKSMLDLLQSNVLAHNYRELDLKLDAAENVVGEFLCTSIKALTDAYLSELNRKQINNFGLSKFLFYFN